MSNLLKLSKRQPDLLQDSKSRPAIDTHLVNGITLTQFAQHKTEGAPTGGKVIAGHPLTAEGNRLDSIEGMVNQRRLVGGSPQAEQFINELHSASQINRGPAGFSPGSRLHFDMLTGRDDRIGFSDYLNFENRFF